MLASFNFLFPIRTISTSSTETFGGSSKSLHANFDGRQRRGGLLEKADGDVEWRSALSASSKSARTRVAQARACFAPRRGARENT